MNSYEFEVAAKNAVIKSIRKKYGEDYIIGEIQMVWFAHILGYKKSILIDMGPNNRIYEVTYNKLQNEMYVDAYVKESNTVLTDFDMVARV